MKKIIAAALLLVVAGAATAQAGVDLRVNVGIPVPMPPAVTVHYPSQPRVIHQEYVREEAPRFIREEAPRFIYSQNLGFYVSVGTPDDIVYLNDGYYNYRGGSWYNAATYGGPWTAVSHRRLPHELRKHRYERVRHFRDREYRAYLRDGDCYRGSWHRPGNVREVGHRDHRKDDRWNDRRDHRGDHRGDDRRDDRRGHGDDRRDGRH